MPKFTLEIETNNDAFNGSNLELCRIMREMIAGLSIYGKLRKTETRKLYDSNGNSVGNWKFEP